VGAGHEGQCSGLGVHSAGVEVHLCPLESVNARARLEYDIAWLEHYEALVRALVFEAELEP
jgi:hypothetical protein